MEANKLSAMASVAKYSAEHGGGSKGPADMEAEEEEEELFEINLDAVNSIPPPPTNYFESYFMTSTGNALLANCLLPISDVSSAVPTVSRTHNNDAKALWLSAGTTSNVVLISAEPMVMPLGKLLQLPFSRALASQHKVLKAA